jgi:HSP20 family protein
MTLVRLQPFRNVNGLPHELDRLFDNLVARRQETAPDLAFTPAAEIYHDVDNIYLQLEVPGLTPAEITVEVNAANVVVSGERQEETHPEGQAVKRSEFRYGKFYRSINLPAKIQIDRVHAKYENGILKLTLPKVEEAKNKTVKVLVEA